MIRSTLSLSALLAFVLPAVGCTETGHDQPADTSADQGADSIPPGAYLAQGEAAFTRLVLRSDNTFRRETDEVVTGTYELSRKGKKRFIRFRDQQGEPIDRYQYNVRFVLPAGFSHILVLTDTDRGAESSFRPASCDELGGQCANSGLDPTFPADCEGELQMDTEPDVECAAINEVCCVPAADPCDGVDLPACPRTCTEKDFSSLGQSCPTEGPVCGNKIGDGVVCQGGTLLRTVHPPLGQGCNLVCR